MNEVVIGVDPGLGGALAALRLDGALQSWLDTPHADGRVFGQKVADWLMEQEPIVMVVVENVRSRPGQGVTSVFTFGRAYGTVEGIVAALHLPTTQVLPVLWKRRMQVTKDKKSSRTRAADLWPDNRLDFARVADDGRAEAALIARWWLERTGA